MTDLSSGLSRSGLLNDLWCGDDGGRLGGVRMIASLPRTLALLALALALALVPMRVLGSAASTPAPAGPGAGADVLPGGPELADALAGAATDPARMPAPLRVPNSFRCKVPTRCMPFGAIGAR
jgi:hypothetical protein